MYSACEIEDMIYKFENIRIIIRCDPYEKRFESPYKFERKTSDNKTIGEWYDLRLKSIIGTTQFDVFRGDGHDAYLTETIGTIRQSYIHSK